MTRCLVIAGGSYVGRHLVKCLAEAGFRVDFTYRTRSPAVVAIENLHGVQSIECDFSRPTSLDGEYEIIINSCGAYSAGSSNDDVIVMPNVNSAAAILELARISSATKLIINFSSLSVYGWPLPPLISASTRAAPTDLYGSTKLVSEQLLALTGEAAALVNLRFPVVLGRNAHRAFLPTVLQRLLANEVIMMSNSEERYFACTSLQAVADLTVNLIRNPLNRGTHISTPLSCVPDMSIREMLDFMRMRVRSRSEIQEIPSTRPSAVVECAEAVSLGYTPPILSDCLSAWLEAEGFQ